ncbi:MAG TPA: GNAT family N-acetyltransferase [Usitatibacter sp.]|nr:GNAT family N-acetyltransferase [Usitatibacter sp.]
MSQGHYLAALFEPRSVALVGASERADKVGGRVLENLRSGGYGGALFAVNPKYAAVRGVPCVPSVDRLPEPVDLAVIATPPATVPGIVERCGRRGIRAAIVITAGFSEAGPEGARLEGELLAAARAHGVRVMGPNCIGLMRPPIGLNATFARGQGIAGALALVSQSGAVCTAMLDWASSNGVGFSSVISLGGSTDLDFGEVVDYLSVDEKTEHILLYIEGVRDGRRLVSSLRAAARIKPVILMKVGRHPAGSRAAVSHTGAIVGKDDVFDAVVRRTGAVRVRSMADLVGAAQALASHVRPSGDRLAVITNGGGPGVMAADWAADLGMELATLAPATVEALRRVLPANWSHGNPIDLIGDAGPERYRAAVGACLADPGVDGIVAVLTPQAMTQPEESARAVAEAAQGAAKPVIAAWMGESSVEAARVELRKAGLPVFRGPEMAVETFAHLAQFYRNQRALLEAPGPLAHRDPPDLQAAHALVGRALDAGRTQLSGPESKALLEAFRIPVARTLSAPDPEAAVRAAREVGFPVVMKIDSPDVTHKSDVGGVRLAIPDAEAVRAAFADIVAGVAARKPSARIAGVTVEPLVARPHGRELMVGVARDAIFGPAISFGAGGIAVEVLRDRTVALPPLNAILVADMIRGTRVARVLGEFRNLPAADRGALEAVLLHISEMACELPELEEVDINPLIADEDGAIAVDARVVLRAAPAQRTKYAHLAILPYPGELQATLRLPGGEWVKIRPIRPEDAAMEQAFVEGLSRETSRLRFQSSLTSLTPSMLARFTQIDYDREMALVAVREEGGVEREIAVCRYITLPDGRSCEYAIVIADEWQGRGLGRRMMAALIDVARARGLKTMIGWVLAGNAPMLRLCAELGFVSAPDEDPYTRRMELALDAAPAAR